MNSSFENLPGASEASNPPIWAEAIIRSVLPPRDRETVTGDLLEEYRESIVPERGPFRAWVWYVWQTAALFAMKGRSSMRKGTNWLWLAGALAWMTVIVTLLVRSRFSPPHLPPWILVIPAILIAAALTSIRSRTDLLQLWKDARMWAALLIVAGGVRALSDLLAPLDVEQYFLEQARAGFSETHYPGRLAFGASIALILIAAGFHGAWKTARCRTGVLVAFTAALLIAAPLFAIQSMKPDGPVQILVVAAAIGSVFGAAGAMLGKALRGSHGDLQTE